MRVRAFSISGGVRRRLTARAAGVMTALTCAFLVAQPVAAQTPFNGSAWTVPGSFQAEDFDNGAAGVAYKDNTPGNSGVGYRSTDVDIASTSIGGYAVGWIGAGEWLRYTINVASSGNYKIIARVASSGSGGTFHIEFNGVDRTGPLTVPNTGGWNNYRDLPVVVSLSSGVQAMKVVFDTAGASGAVANVSFFSFAKTTEAATIGSASTSNSTSSSTSTPSPFGGTPWAIPGGIQAEDFDNGGQNSGYHDKTSGNNGGLYRQTDVDVGKTASGYAVGWVSAGEWLKYTVNVASSGTYKVVVRAASAGTGGTFHIEFNGANKSGKMTVPNTGGWSTYADVVATVSLSSGVQTMKLVFDTNGSSGAVGNFSFLNFTKTTTTTAPAPEPAPSGTGGKLRIMTWNVHFGKNASNVANVAGQAKLMADSGAHVILLQEVWQGDMVTKLPQLLQQYTGVTWYTYWVTHNGTSTGEGVLTLSRLPFSATNKANWLNRGFSRVQVKVGGVPVSIFNAHLDWDTTKRTSELKSLMSWARTFAGHSRVVGGDFNSWWGESWIKTMETEYTDTWQDVTGSDQNGYTLNGTVRFDYLFRALDTNWRLQPTSCWVPSTSLSDHKPVVAEYTVK
jgi:endonuclease/exonuclease/phosphatase family metal-dependent hydrolase